MSTLLQEMKATVAALTAPGKGILAADESTGTIEKRFKVIKVRSTDGSLSRGQDHTQGVVRVQDI